MHHLQEKKIAIPEKVATQLQLTLPKLESLLENTEPALKSLPSPS